MTSRFLAAALIAWLAVALPAGAALASAKRVALVIGNSAYQHAAVLDNPSNDARDIAAALTRHGFETIKGVDLDHANMLETIRQFARALQGADTAVFFYAGHGIQIANRNYLVPIDARLNDSFGIDFELVRLERIHRMMEESAKVNLLFLDACRNNPLARNLARSMGTRSASIGDGLAPMESGVGSLISFSTQPGNVALDGRGSQNSPYSAALAKHIATGNGDITEILIKVRRDVMVATSRKQIPWEHSALTRQFYFAEPAATPVPPPASAITGETIARQAELVFWQSVKDSNDRALLQAYLDRYPSGTFAPLASALIARLETTTKTKTAEAPTPRNETTRAGIPEPPSQARADTGPKPTPSPQGEPPERIAMRAAPPPGEAATDSARTSETPTSRAAPPPDPELRTALVKRIQERLKDLGCYRGAIDGDWGRGSSGALDRALAEKPLPASIDMQELTATSANTVLAALTDDVRENCAKPATSTVTQPRRASPESRTKSRPSRAQPARKTATKPARRCRSKMNPERFTDEKAPMMITVCE